jgi:murein DD-endopeptidase MepM/ murein hydrolase activator NlpD
MVYLIQNRCIQLAISIFLLPGFLQGASVMAAQDYSSLNVSQTGQLQMSALQTPGKAHSPDGSYMSNWRVGRVGHDQRELLDFELLHNGATLYHLDCAPGSDLYMADNGICVFLQHLHGSSSSLRLSFLDRDGQLLLEHLPAGVPTLFSFSPTGDRFAVGNSSTLELIELPTGDVTTLPGGWEIALSDKENLTAVADANRLHLFRGDVLTADLKTHIPLPRRVVFSPDNETVALAGRTRLEIYHVPTGALLGTVVLDDGRTFRDLHCSENRILAGVQLREDTQSSGFLQVYSRQGELLEEYSGDTRTLPHAREAAEARNVSRQRETIPWPFFPFDSMRTVWNHYEQHMGGYGVEYSYLHQGLDLIIPVAEPVYAVESGIVKCVLTLGGAVYWRTAVSPVQEPGWSTGWLYAHLIESSIQVDIGDTVEIHDYLGDIIQWSDDWGHIHFAEIEDSGMVWQYDDNEWGITRDPMPLLDPLPDNTAPVFEDVFPGSRFAFCRNNGSLYLDADDLDGAVDVIVKVYDLAGPSPWQQPAHSLYYWIERMADGQLVVPRTLSQVLDHAYPFYSSNNYEPWATLFYVRDELLQPSSWMDTTRNYHQILTNNNGDSLALLSEKDLALETTDFQNGFYRIFAEAQDDNGNFSRDSMEVCFNNPGNDWVPQITGLWINDGMLYIDWDEIPVATGYIMYSSPQPYSEFTVDSSGTYNGSSWHTEMDTGAVRYYRVTAEIR